MAVKKPWLLIVEWDTGEVSKTEEWHTTFNDALEALKTYNVLRMPDRWNIQDVTCP